MKNRILILAAGLSAILAVWIFIPKIEDEPAVYVSESFDDEIYFQDFVIVEMGKDFLKGIAANKKKQETEGKRQRTIDISVEDEEVTYEPETSEEVREEILANSEGVVLVCDTASENYAVPVEEARIETYAETVAYETQSQTAAETVGVTQVASEAIDIYGLLRVSLENAGIGWWYPYAVAQMTQESHCNPWAVSADGLDYGLFQFRLEYWKEPESIFDVDAQIRKYVSNTCARINAGLSIEEVISRHFTSDYVIEINWKYVQDVLQHLN